MDDFIVYQNSFDGCLNNLSKVLEWCIESDLVLNIETFSFHGISWNSSTTCYFLKGNQS